MKKLRTLLFVVLGLAFVGPLTVARGQEARPGAESDPSATSAPTPAPTEATSESTPNGEAAASAPSEPAAQAEPALVEESIAVPALPASGDAAGAATLSAAELESMGLELDNRGLDTSIRFSGFSDFTTYTPIKPGGAASVGLPRHSSFYVGNLNLYVSKNLSEAFRTMAEVRFTFLPNGSTQGAGLGSDPVDSTVRDYAENNRTIRYGAIIMQRVYLEWTMHRLITVRAGQFLTPYGIWNVDHGSPAYIPTQRPYAVNSNYFPERQTGLEMFGRYDAGNFNTFGYHLTLSNGVGSISEYRDLDDNKAIGGRLYWESHRVGYFRLGTSGYYGRATNSLAKVNLGGTKVDVNEVISLQYDALALAADMQFKVKGFHLQAEWVSQQRRYTKDGRTVHGIVLGPVARGFSQDSFSWGGYGLLAYQFDWFGLTPFVMAQYNSEMFMDPLYDTRLRTVALHGGLNVHPIDAVTLKAEYLQGTFPGANAFFSHPIRAVEFQAAWAF
ncbi:MAG: hypothetical protein QM778_25220 [Myxococcales bacterium]